MPSTYAHYVFGKEVYEQYPKSLREKISRYRPLYDIGLHGPDILFYYHALFSNPVNQIGYSMHGKPAWTFFERAAQLLKEAGEKKLQDQELAYLCGFLCHFALDSSCHGYVEKKIQVSGITHTEIEVEFDRSLLVRDGKDPLRQCLTTHIIPTPENARVIAPFFETLTAANVERSLRSMIRYNHLLIAPHPLKRQIIYALLRLTGNYKEMHGLLINLEPNPACRDSNAGLTQRMNEAVPLCLQLTDNFLKVVWDAQAPDPWFERTFSFEDGWQNIVIGEDNA